MWGNPPSAEDRCDRRTRWLALASVFLLIVGVRWWMVGRYGSDLPFWDQWDAEGDFIFRRYFTGTLTLGDWFAPHNEHRIPLTRLLSFVLMRADGQWDARVQMTVNALLAATLVVGTLLLVAGRAPRRWFMASAAALVIMFALPFGWENTLAGFQSQFYLLAGFSLAAMYLLVDARAPSPAWIGGVLGAAAALVSMGSGLLAPAAVLGVITLSLVRERPPLSRAARQAGPTVVACTIIVVIGLMLLKVPAHDPMRAHSPAEFLHAFARALAWPWTNSAPWALLGWAPVLVFAVAFVRGRVPDGHEEKFVLAMAIWTALQAAALAYARSGAIAPRYGDVLCFGVLANGLALVSWIRSGSPRGIPLLAIACVWVIGTGVALVGISLNGSVTLRANEYAIERGRTAAFVRTGDARYLVAPMHPLDIPYPDAKRLERLLRDPLIRSFLPGSVQERPSLSFAGTAPTRVGIGAWEPGSAPDAWEPAWSFDPPGAGGNDRFSVVVTKRAIRPLLLFYVRGSSDTPSVADEHGSRARTATFTPHGSAWRPVLASCPTRLCEISGSARPPGTAITEPREIGRLAALAFALTWNAAWVVAAGTALGAAAVASWLAGRRSTTSAEPS